MCCSTVFSTKSEQSALSYRKLVGPVLRHKNRAMNSSKIMINFGDPDFSDSFLHERADLYLKNATSGFQLASCPRPPEIHGFPDHQLAGWGGCNNFQASSFGTAPSPDPVGRKQRSIFACSSAG